MRKLFACLTILLLAGCSQSADTSASTSAPLSASSVSSESVSDTSAISSADNTGQTTPSAHEPVAASESASEAAQETERAATLLYQGHASLRIVTANGKVIYIDPYAGEGYDLPADLILITHAHFDHNGLDKIAEQSPDCLLFTQEEALAGGTHQTFSFDDVTIEAVEAGYNANHDVNSCVGYLLTFSNGATVYVSGDTSTTPQMEELAERNIDFAFFCCDGIYNMDLEEAAACAEKVAARHSIPYHMIASNQGTFDQGRADAFQAEGKIILAPGDELSLTGQD